jgi:hypothetical protein
MLSRLLPLPTEAAAFTTDFTTAFVTVLLLQSYDISDHVTYPDDMGRIYMVGDGGKDTVDRFVYVFCYTD